VERRRERKDRVDIPSSRAVYGRTKSNKKRLFYTSRLASLEKKKIKKGQVGHRTPSVELYNRSKKKKGEAWVAVAATFSNTGGREKKKDRIIPTHPLDPVYENRYRRRKRGETESAGDHPPPEEGGGGQTHQHLPPW